jgi:hypothetical protein
VNDITLLDSWVISAQGHFTKNTDLFPRKFSNSFNGCPMKAVVFDGKWDFTTKYIKHIDSKWNAVSYIEGIELKLLKVVLQKMNMTFLHVPTPVCSEGEEMCRNKFLNSMLEKEIYILLGDLALTFSWKPYYDFTSSYFYFRIRWYVPCSIKYPR